MQAIDSQYIKDSIAELRISKSLQRQLNLSAFSNTSAEEWQHYDFIGLPTKNNQAGILFLEPHDKRYAVPYEISPLPSGPTGRAKPIICDFCKTWQAGGRAGSITFRVERRSSNSISFLCCLDLKCSLHVRDRTSAAKSSRAQLREDITPEHRVERLRSQLDLLIERLNLNPLY